MFVSNKMFTVGSDKMFADDGDNGNLPIGQILLEPGGGNGKFGVHITRTLGTHSMDILENNYDPDEKMDATSPLQNLPPEDKSGPVALPYTINMDSMTTLNTDLLDLSKPIRGYMLRKGTSNISLDSLNDNYVDNFDALKTKGSSSCEGSLENLLELSQTIQDYHTAEELSDFERWNNFVNLEKNGSNYGTCDFQMSEEDENTNFVAINNEELGLESARQSLAKKGPLLFRDSNHLQKGRVLSSQIHNKLYGPLMHSAPTENMSSNSTMSIATTSSLKSADFASSPESYEMLYKSFEIAAFIDEEDRRQGRELSASVPNIEMLSPKLQRLRQQCSGTVTSPEPNFCTHHENMRRFEEEVAKAESASRKVTFADLAQQRKKKKVPTATLR